MKIVYVTNTGSTKQYAEMLSEKTGFEAAELSAAVKSFSADEEIIFMGWVMAGALQGYKEAKAAFTNIRAVCGVGLFKGEKAEKELIEKNGVTEPLFALQGNFSVDRLKGMYKMMMSMMIKMLKSKLKENPQPDADKVLAAFEAGVECVSEENLEGILAWLKEE